MSDRMTLIDEIRKTYEEELAKQKIPGYIMDSGTFSSMQVMKLMLGDLAIHTDNKGETTIIPKDELPDWVKFYLDTKK